MTYKQSPYSSLHSDFTAGKGELFHFSRQHQINSMFNPCTFSDTDLVMAAVQTPENAALAVKFYCMKVDLNSSREYAGSIQTLVKDILGQVAAKENSQEFIDAIRKEVTELEATGHNALRLPECTNTLGILNRCSFK